MSDLRYPLTASLWFRRSTDEWVLEVDGTINDTGMTVRFTQPGKLPPEEAVGLPTLFTNAGWLFHNPDTGIELSTNHPVESGEVPDAENIREADIPALKEALLEAWQLNADITARNQELSEKLQNVSDELDNAKNELSVIEFSGGS